MKKGFKLNDETPFYFIFLTVRIGLKMCVVSGFYPPLTGGMMATSAFGFKMVVDSLSFST